ncbi:MAG: (Fe-S)-binding protein [Planctomycetes bacterium]|nr:(Fe-S)-binding protein [Planctomycetota bacterium]
MSTTQKDLYQQTLGCVHCGLCLPVCPTYRVLGMETDSPRGRIYLMRALGEGRIENLDVVRTHLDRCLDCRACETACPSGVQYGNLLESVRGDLEQKAPSRGLRPRIARFMVRHLLIHQRRLRLAFSALRAIEVVGLRKLARILRLIPRSLDAIAPPVPSGTQRAPLKTGLHQPIGPVRGRVGLFTGCVMEPMFGHVNRATLAVLLANGFEVVIPKAQRCCGALLVHMGLPDDARTLAKANIAAFADCDVILNNSAGCGAALKEYGHLLDAPAAANFAKKCRDICEFLDSVGLTQLPAARNVTIAYDDPCHLCHAQGIREAPRKLLQQVDGLKLVAHARPEDCCGSAGIYNLLQPELAAEIGRRKAETLTKAGAQLVVTGNPGCMIQIGASLRGIGDHTPVCHPVELLVPPAAK